MLTNRFQGDQSKTRLNIPFHTEVNQSVDLNHNFMFRLSFCLKLKYNARSNPKDTSDPVDPMYFQFLFLSSDCPECLTKKTFHIAGSLHSQARWPFCHPANSVKPPKGYFTDSTGLTTASFNACYMRDAMRKDGLYCQKMSLCLSVWMSHAGIVSKRLNLS